MAEPSGFLAAIVAAPDDDTPRLVYADWLEEHSDPDRAAVIRLQCEAARLDLYDPRRYDLEDQAEALVLAHRGLWWPELDDWVVAKIPSYYERGFPVRATNSLDLFLDRGDGLFAILPIRDVSVNPGSGDGGTARFPELVRWPYLDRLRRLDLSGVTRDRAAVAALLASPRLAGLTGLGLYPPDDQSWVAGLLATPLRAAVTELGLRTVRPTADLADLAAAGVVGRLRSLLVSNGSAAWSADAGRAFAAGRPDRLENLTLASGLDGPAVRALAAGPPLPSLRRLHIANARLTADAVAGLAEWLASDRLPGLVALAVWDRDLPGSGGVAALAGCPALARLRELDLSNSGLGGVHARALAASPHLTNLRVLRLWGNRIPGRAARELAASPFPAGLRRLDLSGNPIPAQDVRAIDRLLGPGVFRRLY